MLARMWIKESTHLLLVVNVYITIEGSVTVPQKDRNQPTLRPSYTTLGHPKATSFSHRDTCSTKFIAILFIKKKQNLTTI